MNLKGNWTPLVDGVDDASCEPVNQIADAVIKNEEDIEELKKQGGSSSVTVDDKMSNTSKNPVQNKVVKKYVDDSIKEAILDSWEVPV